MENKAKVWIARDKDGDLFVFSSAPFKVERVWSPQSPNINTMELKSDKFSSVKWEDDEPTEAYITLTAPKEIDWEQRRYEIAKDILKSLVADLVVESAVEDKERFSKYAINIADTLINKLKKESDA